MEESHIEALENTAETRDARIEAAMTGLCNDHSERCEGIEEAIKARIKI